MFFLFLKEVRLSVETGQTLARIQRFHRCARILGCTEAVTGLNGTHGKKVPGLKCSRSFLKRKRGNASLGDFQCTFEMDKQTY